MNKVPIRELRNRCSDVVDRVARGEHLTITRGGKPVAELRPLGARGPAASTLLQRWSRLPVVDFPRLRGDLDAIIEPGV